MGFLKWLRPTMPNLSTTPTTLYQATIATESGSHEFQFLVDPQAGPYVIYNEVSFVLPKDAVFAVTDSVATVLDGEKIPVKFIAPIDPGEANDVETFTPPDDLLGKEIPAVDNRDEWEDRFDEPSESVWKKLGRKSKRQ